MQELRVLVEARGPTGEGDRMSRMVRPCRYDVASSFRRKLGVDAESNDYRIIRKGAALMPRKWTKIPAVDRLNDFYYTYDSLPADLQEDYAGADVPLLPAFEELHQHS